MEKKSIGSFIAALRKASGLTQKQLADKLNVSDKAVSRWERDESAPDLTLIPVIAEIFGVTSDELLRGQRASAEQNPERAAEKTEKQVRYLLKDTLTKYKVRSFISVAVALVGLIAAMIGNLGFLRGYIGFMAGCIFFVAAIVCQASFLVLGFSALDQEEFDDALVAPSRKALVYGAEIVFGIILFLLAFCLPLVIFPPDTNYWLMFGSWMLSGSIFGLISAVAALIVCTVINLKLGYWSTARFKTPLWRLRFKAAAILLVLVLVIGAGQFALRLYLEYNHETIATSHVFYNWEDFRKLMETPTDVDGQPLTYMDGYTDTSGGYYLEYQNSAGDVYAFHSDEVFEKMYANENDAEPVVQFRRLNLSISEIIPSDTGDLLPVHVFTHDQYAEVQHTIRLIMLGYSLLYLLPLVGVGIWYRKKRNF